MLEKNRIMEDFMFCAKCGTQLNEGSEFCSKCGTKVGLSTEAQDIESQKSETKQTITQVTVMPSGTGPLVMGLLGLFGGFIPVVKYITGLLSLLAIFIGVSQKKKLKGAGLPTGKATAGIVLGTIAVLITVITIAFSAMIVGSLFSNNKARSGNNRSSGLFVNRTLPTGIQNTIWSNGNVNVEFGKNKVKLNNEWYSVKGIATGDTGPFTWVYFGDDYIITLQRWSNNELKLARLSHEYARVEDGIGGFMTPAEMEARRKIIGEWEGSYDVGNGETGMRLVVYDDMADFYFFSLPGKSNIENGSYRMYVYYDNGVYEFSFLEWIVQPRDYFSLDCEGELNGNVLSGTLRGNISFIDLEITGTFYAERKLSQ